MRTIEQSNLFKRDLKREAKGRHRTILANSFTAIVKQLAGDEKLDAKYKDHALSGNWKDHRDCHIKPDLVLVYRKPDNKLLQLIRLGSHSELGL